jgi:hypothetical protein
MVGHRPFIRRRLFHNPKEWTRTPKSMNALGLVRSRSSYLPLSRTPVQAADLPLCHTVALTSPVRAASAKRPWSPRERLDECKIAELITAYRDGATAASLATTHGLSLRSVKRLPVFTARTAARADVEVASAWTGNVIVLHKGGLRGLRRPRPDWTQRVLLDGGQRRHETLTLRGIEAELRFRPTVLARRAPRLFLQADDLWHKSHIMNPCSSKVPYLIFKHIFSLSCSTPRRDVAL